jgi:hypothetical protein
MAIGGLGEPSPPIACRGLPNEGADAAAVVGVSDEALREVAVRGIIFGSP